jgi:deaminated glutathione amidase
MRICILQMSPGQDKSANIAQAQTLVDRAVNEHKPRLISFPEVWTCLGGSVKTRLANGEDLPEPGSRDEGGPAYSFLRDIARKNGMYVHGGSIGEKLRGKLANTTLVFDPEGTEIARYRKIHLFDVVTPDGTGYRESADYIPGDSIVTFDLDGMKVGCAICYDIRFPEMFWSLRRAGAELILLPAAFTLQTGKDHWEALIRARAIETQCWFAASATWGPNTDASGETRFTYGHSLICDPWGHVVAKASDGIGSTSANVDRAFTERIRRNMPVLEHRVAI